MTRNAPHTSDDPALDPRVRALLVAAAAPVETTGSLPGEEEALAAFRVSPDRTRRTSMIARLGSVKAAAASAIGTSVLLAGGVGAAAAGVLPGAAQETISAWLGTVGISVPAGEGGDKNGDPVGRSEQSPGEKANENADRRGPEQTPADKDLPPAADHGERVSDTAKNSSADGADKGKEISEVASDGRVKSDDHPAGEDHGGPPASTPNSGDANHGQEQSAGAADRGTATADESSDGASSAGLDNRPDGD
jgi:hypothetical protein